jgi:uncharacterized protein (DUF1684 family)
VSKSDSIRAGAVGACPAGWLVLLAACWALVTASPTPLTAQQAELERERAEFGRWLASAPTSPLRAIALIAIGPGIRLGPLGADVPISGAPETIIVERGGRITATVGGTARPLPRGRPVELFTDHTLLAGGAPGRTVLTVFSKARGAPATPAGWFPYQGTAALDVTLEPPGRAGTVRVLSADGIEVDAAEAGTIRIAYGGQRATLIVRRMPGATPDESELEVYFRDRTNGKGTYPAGRFVALIPVGEGRYRLDFNRARNPYCAYKGVYPCPAPWRGNTIAAPVEAGERYSGGGLDPGEVIEGLD